MRLLLAALLLSACPPVDSPGFSAPEPTPTPAPVEAPPWWGWSDAPITDVQESTDLGLDAGCVQALEDCAADYYAFADLAADHARPISEEDLHDALTALAAGVPALDGPTDPVALGGELADALNLGFLLDDLHARPLDVVTIRFDELPDVDELELLFTDPWVGTFRGILRLPRGIDWKPPILGIHGHGTEAVDVFDGYGGAELAEAGHPVLALDLRVNYADELEDAVQRHLLRSGFSLLQLRIYEAFLGLKYLRARGDMEPGLGVLAHSGGAAAMNVGLRLAPRVSAYAMDNRADYDCIRPGDFLLDDAVPAVHPYRALINDLVTIDAAVLEQEYGFPEGPEPLVAFFGSSL